MMIEPSFATIITVPWGQHGRVFSQDKPVALLRRLTQISS
jgi:hypothetical protein